MIVGGEVFHEHYRPPPGAPGHQKGRTVGNIAAVTDAEFESEVLKSDKPVLVDFWAEWCGPCHAIAPVLDQIAGEHDGLKVVKLNIDEEPAIAQRYGVMSIPTLILFKDGEPQAAAVGAMPKSMLEQRLGLAEAAA